MEDIVWQSTLTEDMTEHLNAQEISMLLNELNDVVANICENYDIS